VFTLVNKKKQPGNFITAEVTKMGYFKFTVENEPKDSMGCRGWWLFEVAWDFWVNNQKTTIKGIRGDWTYGDNLRTINDLTAGGRMTIEEAARHTWTYQQAMAKGFTTYQEIDPPVGSPGNYTDVQVVFLP
jgi:hypothetical protein